MLKIYNFLGQQLFILPRWYFSRENLKRLREEGKSKSFVGRIRDGIRMGCTINFECDATERFITSYEKQTKSEFQYWSVETKRAANSLTSTVSDFWYVTIVGDLPNSARNVRGDFNGEAASPCVPIFPTTRNGGQWILFPKVPIKCRLHMWARFHCGLMWLPRIGSLWQMLSKIQGEVQPNHWCWSESKTHKLYGA